MFRAAADKGETAPATPARTKSTPSTPRKQTPKKDALESTIHRPLFESWLMLSSCRYRPRLKANSEEEDYQEGIVPTLRLGLLWIY
jgi:hypothetical protein